MDIDRRAAEVQRLANERFDTETKGVSRFQWKAIADRIADEVFGDDWEWLTSEEVGGRISFIVTAYNHAPEVPEEGGWIVPPDTNGNGLWAKRQKL